jgi:hypothetical protein
MKAAPFHLHQESQKRSSRLPSSLCDALHFMVEIVIRERKQIGRHDR